MFTSCPCLAIPGFLEQRQRVGYQAQELRILSLPGTKNNNNRSQRFKEVRHSHRTTRASQPRNAVHTAGNGWVQVGYYVVCIPLEAA